MARTRDPFQHLHPVLLRQWQGWGWELAVITVLLLGWLIWESTAHPRVQPELIQQGEQQTALQAWQRAAELFWALFILIGNWL